MVSPGDEIALLTGAGVSRVPGRTSQGARSGRPRRTPLLCIHDRSDHPTTFALIASNWGQRHAPSWYYNLKGNPQATCAIAGQVGTYVAHEAVGEEYDRFWRYAADAYPGYPLYRRRVGGRSIPIMVMTPLQSRCRSATIGADLA